MKSKSPSLRFCQGFTLLEMSIVLTILAIVATSGLSLSAAKTNQNKIAATYNELQEIAEAIAVFKTTKGCLPYPASQTALPGTSTYGREPAANANCVTGGAGSGAVLQGALPFYSLGLPEAYGSDAWYTRYTYAVVDLAVRSTFSSSTVGTIRVNDSGGTAISTTITYVVASHGPTAKGGYSEGAGVVGTACAAGEKDGENCDADTIFVDTTFNDGTTAANFFDDLVLWKTTSGIY